MKRTFVALFILVVVFSPRAIVAQAAGSSDESLSKERLRDLETLRDVKECQNLRPDLVADIRKIQSRGIVVQAGTVARQSETDLLQEFTGINAGGCVS
jgi:hypothetical protein